jgi:hypothetical protein
MTSEELNNLDLDALCNYIENRGGNANASDGKGGKNSFNKSDQNNKMNKKGSQKRTIDATSKGKNLLGDENDEKLCRKGQMSASKKSPKKSNFDNTLSTAASG